MANIDSLTPGDEAESREVSELEQHESVQAGTRDLSETTLDDLIVAQTEAVSKLAIGIQHFAEQYNKAEEGRKTTGRRIAILVGVILLLAVVIGVGVVRLNTYSSGNRANTKASRENSQIIKDCVQPEGACYKANEARTAETIRKIVDSNNNGEIDTDEILRAIREQEASK